MKSKYYLALLLAGVLPVLIVAGICLWAFSGQKPASKSTAVDTPAVQAAIPLLKTQVDTMASSMSSAIERVNGDIPGLYAHNTDTDLDTFVKIHQGVTGVVVLSPSGKVVRNIPAAPPLITDTSYGTSEEFQKTLNKLKDNGGKPYLFFTLKLGYPAFIFSTSLSDQSIAEVVVNLSNFFRGIDANSGDIFLLEAGSGNFFYHTNPAKWGTPFNPNQEAWLTGLQNDLAEKKGGYLFNPDKTSAVYAPVFAKFGIVHLFPSSILQPPSPAAPASPELSLQNLPQFFTTTTGKTILIGLCAMIGWVLIVGALFFGLILTPLRRASAAVLGAVNGSPLTAEDASRFGGDEVGQMVQSVASLLQKVEEDKKQNEQEKEEAIRRGRAEADSKTKEAAAQVSEAQKAAQAARGELNDKNQQLNDKLKELDALKGMSEGLRNQAEQAKGEVGKLKTQVAAFEEAKGDMEKSLKDTQTQFKEMETKLLQAVGASSAIKVSQVRAAAIRTMSEELKTTLGIIKGYVSSALGTTQGGINEKQQEFLGMVINRSARLEKFINDLVDIYQVEIEQQEAKHEEVNLASEIEGLAFNFQAQAEVKNIKMKVEAKPNIPKVPIVRRRFNQLWNILYLQVIKDAPRGSNITILVEPVGDLVKVTLQDPGMIVAPESLPRLFDEFYDPKHTASPQLAGTGLKFALVKTILAAHGGGAVAEKADPGTRLLLTFATKVKKPGDAPAPAAAPVAAPKLGVIPASPSVTAPGIKAPPLMPPGGIGAVKPAIPGIPKPAAPLSPAPASPAPGSPATPNPSTGLGVKPAGTPAPGILDSLLSGKIPPVTAPGVKPPMPSVPVPPPVAPAVPNPSTGLGANPSAGPGAKPPIPVPGMPSAAPPVPGAKPAPGLLDALLEKKPAPPPVPGASTAPVPGAPPIAPNPSAGLGVKPPMGAPGMMPPPVPIPSAPKPPMPGTPPAPAAPPVPAAPKVVPTGLKPAPASGVLDMDHADGPKLDAAAPKPSAPPPGAPPAGLKPPAPGVPPGGLNASAPTKKDEGELIE